MFPHSSLQSSLPIRQSSSTRFEEHACSCTGSHAPPRGASGASGASSSIATAAATAGSCRSGAPFPIEGGSSNVSLARMSCCCCCTHIGSASASGCRSTFTAAAFPRAPRRGASASSLASSMAERRGPMAALAAATDPKPSARSWQKAVSPGREALTGHARCAVTSSSRRGTGSAPRASKSSATKKRSFAETMRARIAACAASSHSASCRETAAFIAEYACSSARSVGRRMHGGKSCMRERSAELLNDATIPSDLAPSRRRLNHCPMRMVASRRTASERGAKMCEFSAEGGGTRRCR
ncbi:hypothetical protein T484DRAFT_2778325 [Baffinella frigidus]|nr:hypothetical protein T484DRAFT_2778325 [Cryptophyta sp. CCMP2293]|mmetsp:Transcript_63987/g.152605  ORF Transcript_63987/g.152605 Transcript_63987/m.152605 type:complete len:297 (-) Transcript_63987:1704-2594(-)